MTTRRFTIRRSQNLTCVAAGRLDFMLIETGFLQIDDQITLNMGV